MDASIRLMHVGTGQTERLATLTGFLDGWNGLFWHGGQLVITRNSDLLYWSLEHKAGVPVKSVGTDWRSASPDGRYLIGVRFDWGRPSGRYLPATLVVHDIATRTERVIPNVAYGDVRSCFVWLEMAWEPGGKTLLVRDHLAEKEQRLLRLDPATAVADPAKAGAVFEPRAPRTVTAATGWSFTDSGWGKVTLVSSTGTKVERGSGYPLGWTPTGDLLLIRWEHYQKRLLPGGDC